MAIERDNETATLSLKVITGQTTAGNDTYSNRSISEWNPDVQDSVTFQIASTLATLQSRTLEGIYITNKAQLVEDE